jgi:hypothetical protein
MTGAAGLNGAMLLVLRDINPEVVAGWLAELGGHRGVSIGAGDLLRERLDAAVSTANSYGPGLATANP